MAELGEWGDSDALDAGDIGNAGDSGEWGNAEPAALDSVWGGEAADLKREPADLKSESTDLTETEIDNVWGGEAADLKREPADLKSESTDLPEPELDSVWGGEAADLTEPNDAARAADYARQMGFDRAGDYIERHYAGGEFVPGEPIAISTRNEGLEGSTAENGVEFSRRTAQLADGLAVNGVFPEFPSRHKVELGAAANDMSLHQQFAACKSDFQDHMFDDMPQKLGGLTLGDMERLTQPQGYCPEGFTWNHNPETGSFDLVSQSDHAKTAHTGGNALWGK